MKECTKCKTEREISYFNKDRSKPDGYHSHCKPCIKKYAQENREKRAATCRNSKLKSTYGITAEDYEIMLAKQNGVCAICKAECSRRRSSKFFCVDHCHKTLKIRGLLCNRCNTALGLFEDDINRMEIAINYIKDNTNDKESK